MTSTDTCVKKKDNMVHGVGSLQSLFYKPEIPCGPSFADAENQKLHEELNVMKDKMKAMENQIAMVVLVLASFQASLVIDGSF